MVRIMGAGFGSGACSRARRAAAVVPLLVALLSVSLSTVSVTTAAAAGSGALIPWAPESENPASNGTPVPPAQAMQDAANFNFLTAHAIAYAGEVPAMKQVNPNLKVFAYMNATFAQTYQGTTFPSQDYSLDAGGHKITNIKSGNFLMDPSQPDWIQSRIKECEANVAQSGYDGCFLDLLGAAPLGPTFVTGVPINKATSQPWTPNQWLGATANLAAKVRAAVHATTVYGHPILVFGNGLSNGQQFYSSTAPSKQLVASLDGCIAEAWLRQQAAPASWHPTTSQWKQNIQMIIDVEAAGDPLLVITKLWSTATQAAGDAWRQYALATYLLGTQGQSAFFFSYSYQVSRTTALPWYTAAIGTPTAAYAFAPAYTVYERPFTTGLVVVNPDVKSHIVNFPPTHTYYTLPPAHQQVTSATMAPGSGLILTTS